MPWQFVGWQDNDLGCYIIWERNFFKGVLQGELNIKNIWLQRTLTWLEHCKRHLDRWGIPLPLAGSLFSESRNINSCYWGKRQTVLTQPGPIQLTLPLGAIFTISFLSDIVRPYIMARKYCLDETDLPRTYCIAHANLLYVPLLDAA